MRPAGRTDQLTSCGDVGAPASGTTADAGLVIARLVVGIEIHNPELEMAGPNSGVWMFL